VTPPLPEPGSVKTLLLDAGGVLVRPSFTRVAAALGAQGVAVSPAQLVAAEGRAKRELDRPPAPGLETDAQRGWLYFELVLAHAGIARSSATDAALAELRTFHDLENLWEDVLEGVRPSLARFRAAGLRLAVVSNANGTVGRLFERLDLHRSFDAVLDSFVEGVEKPDPRLFQLALERVGGEAATALHVGDMFHVDVVGARAAGLRVVLLDEFGLQPEADCPRIISLVELADHLAPEAAPAAATGSPRHFC
jgi:HAD superfamily hydrolase (TIGR01509 family)